MHLGVRKRRALDMATNIETTEKNESAEKPLPSRILDAAKHIPAQVRDVARDVPARVGEASHAARETLDEQIRTRPLVVGGVAVGVGALLGAMFARTSIAKLLLLTGAGAGAYYYMQRTGEGRQLRER